MNELDTRAERFLESIRAEGEAACAAIRTETDAEIDRQLDEARQAQQAKDLISVHQSVPSPFSDFRKPLLELPF